MGEARPGELPAEEREAALLRTHSQTSGWSLTAQDVFNNVVRTAVEAMAATQGHTQSLHTNALDEALALPTDFGPHRPAIPRSCCSRRAAPVKTIDPWGGSAWRRWLICRARFAKALAHIEEVEASGGMAKAIEAGIPKRIDEAAATSRFVSTRARRPWVGVNKYKPESEAAIDVPGRRYLAVRGADREAEASARRARRVATQAALAELTTCGDGRRQPA